jgi:type II secretory pathway component GspD/PulD (secretin)
MSKPILIKMLGCLLLVSFIGGAPVAWSDSPLRLASDEPVGKSDPFKRSRPNSSVINSQTIRSSNLNNQMVIEKPDLFVETVMLRFLEAENLQKAVLPLNSSFGTVAVDKQTNSLIVCDSQENVKRIVKQIRKADQSPKQIMIEVVIIDVQLNDDTELGVDWNFLFNGQTDLNSDSDVFGGDYSGGRFNKSYNQTLLPDISKGGYWGLIQNGIMVTVKALQQTRNVEILASPRVLVVSGQQALIKTVEEIPYTEQNDTSEGGQLTNTEFKEVGITLTVKATLTDDGRILMKIKPTQSVQTGSSNDNVPIVDSREAETTLYMNNEQVLVLGGLRKKETTLSQDKIPLLGDLPVVGALFSNDKTVINNSELIVLISPKIYDDQPLDEYEMSKFNELRESEHLRLDEDSRPDTKIIVERPEYKALKGVTPSVNKSHK